jgi:hypothetical protein
MVSVRFDAEDRLPFADGFRFSLLADAAILRRHADVIQAAMPAFQPPCTPLSFSTRFATPISLRCCLHAINVTV